MEPWSLLYGAAMGLSLGLTGGGGAIFAVPLLVYGLGLPVRAAVGVSLASVGVTALVGFLGRLRSGQVELPTGILFALAGMCGAPLGAWGAGLIPEAVLMSLFAVVMVVVAVRMWQLASRPPQAAEAAPAELAEGPTCRRDAAGRLVLTSRCARLLMLAGVGSGVLSGLFGVGGGFVIVPALVLFSGMSMHRAVGTSLMVIALVSGSGVVAHIVAGRDIPLIVAGLFATGGVVGLRTGMGIGRRLSGPTLQKVFVVAILAVAVFVLVRNLGA